MRMFGCLWRRRVARFAGAVALPVCLSLTPGARTSAQALPDTTASVPAVTVVFDLAGFPHLALDRQPALAAYRASLAAAQAKAAGIDNLHVPTFIRRDLPIRRKQASLGVTAAQAQVDKAEWETIYAVTRNYLSAVYALQQRRIADQVLSKGAEEPLSLGQLRDVVQGLLQDEDNPRRDLKEWDVSRLDVLLNTARGRRTAADIGERRAVAALREALGIGPDCSLVVPAAEALPPLTVVVVREEVLALAQARRAEIVQACVAAEVTGLEVQAQALSHHNVVPTFASAGDIHAQAVPQGISNGEYRPSATGLEMPPNLAGPRAARVEQAEALHARAEAVVEKTRQLVALEAEDAYLRWEQASRQFQEYQKAANLASATARTISSKFLATVKAGQYIRPTLDEVLDARTRAIQLTVLVNQSHYEALLALAALERITAGGFNPGFDRSLVIPKEGSTDGRRP